MGPFLGLPQISNLWEERRQWSHLRFSGAVSFLRSICRTRRALSSNSIDHAWAISRISVAVWSLRIFRSPFATPAPNHLQPAPHPSRLVRFFLFLLSPHSPSKPVPLGPYSLQLVPFRNMLLLVSFMPSIPTRSRHNLEPLSNQYHRITITYP